MDEDYSKELTEDEIFTCFDSVPEFAEMLELLDVGREDLSYVFDIMDLEEVTLGGF